MRVQRPGLAGVHLACRLTSCGSMPVSDQQLFPTAACMKAHHHVRRQTAVFCLPAGCSSGKMAGTGIARQRHKLTLQSLPRPPITDVVRGGAAHCRCCMSPANALQQNCPLPTCVAAAKCQGRCCAIRRDFMQAAEAGWHGPHGALERSILSRSAGLVRLLLSPAYKGLLPALRRLLS